MRVLILGGGAREHSLAVKLAQSGSLTAVYVAPGNAGTASCARNVEIDPADPAAVLRACLELEIELLVVGPEDPLVAGVADAARAANVV